MVKDKQIQKAPKYSIDKIGAKSDLVTRSLRALGLLKEKKHFTIISPCQFCGRLVNYTFTPCIFCGNFPKTKKEAIVARLLSSNSLEFDHLMGISKAIKDHADLELVIGNLRELTDDILENESKHPYHKAYFRMVEDTMKNEAYEKARGLEYVKRSHIVCNQCGAEIFLADKPCYNCCLRNQEDVPKNNLSLVEKWIVAINNILLFVENYLSMAENRESMEEFIFVTVYIMNNLIEKNELPNNDLKKRWKDLLRKTHIFWTHFSGNVAKGKIKIEDDKVSMEVLKSRTGAEEVIIMSFGSNLAYLLKA